MSYGRVEFFKYYLKYAPAMSPPQVDKSSGRNALQSAGTGGMQGDHQYRHRFHRSPPGWTQREVKRRGSQCQTGQYCLSTNC